MKHKTIFWTTAALLTAAIGLPLVSYAESIKADAPSRQNKQPVSSQTLASTANNVVKVGEYKSATENRADDIIARIKPHELAGKQAATIYVRNIPVLTFLDATKGKTSVGSQTKVATVGNLAAVAPQASLNAGNVKTANTPVWQAAAVAAKINQLHLDNVDASKITVSWKSGNNSAQKKAQERYSIKVGDRELIEINATTQLPDKTKNLSEAALQATNRLRRLIGNASPLKEIAGKPKPQVVAQIPKQLSRRVRRSLSGLASWYGPGFHGNRSASGEIFNQHALTAAHRSLPFGTKVKVTNTRNGRSIVVRINDRGPYAHGRVIDLSAAAARILGVVQSGVAPVRLEVLR